MAEERTPARRDGLGDPPPEVHIEVVLRSRGRATFALIAITIVAIAAIALVVASREHRSNGAPSREHASNGAPAVTGEPGAPSVSAAYGYPARCLAVTVDPGDPAYARADFDRSEECGRYHGYTTAIFHRLGGRWREVLDTSSYSCPVGSLPKAVQEQLAVCPIAETK